MRLVVSDTGPVLHLWEAQLLDLLMLTGEVHIPEAVNTEMPRYWPDWPVQRPHWITVDALPVPSQGAAAAWVQMDLLDAGEAAAIALARQVGADWLLTDDAAARTYALSLGLEVHGSIGIVLRAAAVGQINRAGAEAALDRLLQSSLWVSARVRANARGILAQLFALP